MLAPALLSTNGWRQLNTRSPYERCVLFQNGSGHHRWYDLRRSNASWFFSAGLLAPNRAKTWSGYNCLSCFLFATRWFFGWFLFSCASTFAFSPLKAILPLVWSPWWCVFINNLKDRQTVSSAHRSGVAIVGKLWIHHDNTFFVKLEKYGAALSVKMPVFFVSIFIFQAPVAEKRMLPLIALFWSTNKRL